MKFLLLALALCGCAVSIPLGATVTSNDGGVLTDWSIDGFCDPSVKQFAGFYNVTTKTKEYFYWFFESRGTPSTDPVVLWMTGGPGCSSDLALLAENGPCKVQPDMTTVVNNASWNANANVIWVDQPADVGFSSGAASDLDHNEAEVSRDMYNFLKAFFTEHSDFQKNDFFVFGESYAGHYVPATSHAVFLGNKAGGTPYINLQGLSIGNGLTAPEIQYSAYPEMAYNNSVKQLVSLLEYEGMTEAAKLCNLAIKLCQSTGDECAAAFEGCNLALVTPVQVTGINLYDIRIPCAKPPLCYDFDDITKFLNLESTRKTLGVGDRKWESCNMLVNKNFMGDWMQHFQTMLPDMLAAGIRVLIYAGDVDYICNYKGNKAWTLALDWPHNADFNAAGDHSWVVDGKQAGLARTAANFTFLQVFEAGHMVPMDQPEAALSLLNTFTANKPFY